MVPGSADHGVCSAYCATCRTLKGETLLTANVKGKPLTKSSSGVRLATTGIIFVIIVASFEYHP